MQAIFFYDRQEGNFKVHEHDLEDFLARTLVAELRAQGKEVYAVMQRSTHGVSPDECERCRSLGAEFFGGQASGVESQRSPLAAEVDFGVSGAASAKVVANVKRRSLPLPGSFGLRLFSLFAVIALGLVAYLFTMGPLAPYIEIFTEPILASPTALRAASVSSPAPTATRTVKTDEPTPLPPSLTQEIRLTQPPSPTVSLDHTPTAVFISPAETPIITADCLPYSSITEEDAGQTLCVTGTVTRSYTKNGAFYVVFEDQPGVMYLVSYDREWSAAKEGVCIQVVEKVQMLGQTPIMVYGWKSQLSICP